MAGPVVLRLEDPTRVLDPSTPLLRADDLGVVLGEAVFETLRVAGGRPALLDAHLRRLADGAARLGIVLPGGWEELARAAAATQDDGMLRLTCTKGPPGAGPTGFALAGPLPEAAVRGREQGVRVVTRPLGLPAGLRATAPWLLGGVKCTSYAVNAATLRDAVDAGAQDAIWTSTDGEVLEAPTSTVAVVVDGVLVTPPPEAVGTLPSTTAAALLPRSPVPVEVRRLPVEELARAQEVLLLSSLRGVAPVVELDGRPLAVGPVTAALRETYEALVRKG